MAARKRALRDADHLRADADASLVQRLDRDLVALSDRPEHVLGGNYDVVEDELRRARGADAELVFLLPDGEAREAALDDERGDALVAGARIGIREHDVDLCFRAVRDPHLAAGQHPLVAALFGARRQPERVGAGARLRQRVRADRAVGQAGEVRALEVIAAVLHERIVHQRVLHVDEDRGDASTLLISSTASVTIMSEPPAPPYCFGHLDAHQAELEVVRDERRVELPGVLHLA